MGPRAARVARRPVPREPSFATMSQVADRDVYAELQAIAKRCAVAAEVGGSEMSLLVIYETLRARAEVLAREQGWATSEDLAAQFPSTRALREIERLDLDFGAEAGPALPPGRGMSARLCESLVALSAWATGVRLALEALEDSADT